MSVVCLAMLYFGLVFLLRREAGAFCLQLPYKLHCIG